MPRASYLATALVASLASVAVVSAQHGPAPTGGTPQGSAASATPANLVRASVAPALVRAPGGGEAIAIVITVAPEWHIYWSNPGDSGAAPSVKLELPDSWSSGPLTYPRPEVFGDADERTFGYSGTVHLLVPVRRPAGWTGALEVRGELSWLACRRSCIAGRSALESTVSTDPAASADAPGARSWPRALPAGSSVAVSGAGGPQALTASVKDLPESGTVQFIPDDCAGIRWDGGVGPYPLQWDAATRLWTLRTPISVTPADAPGGAPRVRGLVLVGADPGGRAYFVDIPVPSAPTLTDPDPAR